LFVNLCRSPLVVLFGLLTVCTALQAQTPELERALSSYSASDRIHLESFILQARWEGFPTDLLVAKTAEGAAKGVEVALLFEALSDYAARLDQAHAILGGKASATSLQATAEVMAIGVPDDVVRTVARANREDARLAASMVALGDLVAAGVPPDQAEALLLDAAVRRGENDRVLQIPALVRRWIRQGFQPAEAAAEVRRSLDVPRGPNGGMLDRYIRPQPERPFQPEPPF
jgi:hypothetical protein